jgi:hypothetical protein
LDDHVFRSLVIMDPPIGHDREPLAPEDGPGDGQVLDDLLAAGLARLEADGPGALDAICAEHPEHAQALREHLSALARVGLLESVRRFGRFRILSTLGRGGMGVVYLATDDTLDRLVALKTLPSRVGASERSLQRFEREIAAAVALRHPSIVPIYEVGDEQGTPYFTMEYVPGRTLAEVLLTAIDGSPDEEDSVAGLPTPLGSVEWINACCKIALDVAKGLAHAHGQGVIHRDVKPDNILLGVDGKAHLLDFGLALVAGEPSLTTTGEFTGTPTYAAPEQLDGSGSLIDGRTDVHALGATFYELLTGHRAFHGENAAEVSRRILLDDPVRPTQLTPSLPQDVETICMTALEKRPDKRYADARSMAADLEAYLAGRAIAAVPSNAFSRAMRNMRRRPAKAVAGLLAIAIAVGTPAGLYRSNLKIQAALLTAETERAAAKQAADEARAALTLARSEAARADRADDELALWRDRTGRVDEFLLSILVTPEPFVEDRFTSIGELLRRAGVEAPLVFSPDPLLSTEMHLHLGKAALLIGDYELSDEFLTTAWNASTAFEAPERAALQFAILYTHSTALLRLSRPANAQTKVEAALVIGAGVHPPGDPQIIDMTAQLAMTKSKQGLRTEAHELYGRVLEARRAMSPPDPAVLAKALTNYASTCAPTEVAYAETLLAEAIELQSNLTPGDDFEAAMMLHNRLWVQLYDRTATADDIIALRHARDVFLARSTSGRQGISVSTDLLLGKLLTRMDDSDVAEIEQLYLSAIAGYRATSKGTRLATSLMWLADHLHKHKRFDEALPLLLEAVTIRRTVKNDVSTPTEGFLVAKIVLVLRALGQDEQASQLLAETPTAAQFMDSGSETP